MGGHLPFALVLDVAAAPVLAAPPVLLRTVLSTADLVPLAVHVGIPRGRAAAQRPATGRSTS